MTMNLKRSMSRPQALILGAINGLLYGLTALQVFRVHNAYLYERQLETAERAGITPAQVTYNYLNWPVVIVWMVILFSLFSYLAYRHWSARMRSAVKLWLAIGILSVTAWNLIQLTLACLEALVTGQGFEFRELTSWTNPQFGPISFVLVLAVNSVYGAIMQLFSPQYSQQGNLSGRFQ